jgi:methionine salvage enolase-phosphatase E1
MGIESSAILFMSDIVAELDATARCLTSNSGDTLRFVTSMKSTKYTQAQCSSTQISPAGPGQVFR